MNVYWLFLATLLCSFFGYRLAVHYRLSGITGLVISLTLCVTLGTSLWQVILSWLLLGDHLVTASGTLLTVATLFAFVEKYKFVAILKITSMLFPVSFASVSLPHFATTWNPEGTRTVALSLRDLASSRDRAISSIQYPGGVPENQPVPGKYYGKVSTKSVLYNSSEKGLVKSSLSVEKGTWVLAGSQVAEATGRRWVNVMLPDSNGHFVPETCAVGYIPLSNISEKRASLPSP